MNVHGGSTGLEFGLMCPNLWGNYIYAIGLNLYGDNNVLQSKNNIDISLDTNNRPFIFVTTLAKSNNGSIIAAPWQPWNYLIGEEFEIWPIGKWELFPVPEISKLGMMTNNPNLYMAIVWKNQGQITMVNLGFPGEKKWNYGETPDIIKKITIPEWTHNVSSLFFANNEFIYIQDNKSQVYTINPNNPQINTTSIFGFFEHLIQQIFKIKYQKLNN